jgi:hypothetical protein
VKYQSAMNHLYVPQAEGAEETLAKLQDGMLDGYETLAPLKKGTVIRFKNMAPETHRNDTFGTLVNNPGMHGTLWRVALPDGRKLTVKQRNFDVLDTYIHVAQGPPIKIVRTYQPQLTDHDLPGMCLKFTPLQVELLSTLGDVHQQICLSAIVHNHQQWKRLVTTDEIIRAFTRSLFRNIALMTGQSVYRKPVYDKNIVVQMPYADQFLTVIRNTVQHLKKSPIEVIDELQSSKLHTYIQWYGTPEWNIHQRQRQMLSDYLLEHMPFPSTRIPENGSRLTKRQLVNAR